MKKSLKIVLVVMLVAILMFSINSLAATSNVKLTASKTSVTPGEEFTVSVSLESEEDILGIASLLEFDSNLFELKNKKIEQNGTNLDAGEDKRLDLSMNEAIKSGNIFTLTFAVKDNVSAQTSEIRLKDIELSKQDYTEISVEDQVVSIDITNKQQEPELPVITLSKIEITKAPDKVDYTEGEKFNPAGLVIKAVYSDGTQKEITDYTYSPNTELKAENKLITFSYGENGVTKSTTQAINVKATPVTNNNTNNNVSTNQNNNKTTNNTTNNTAKNATNNTTKNTSNNTTNDVSMTNSNLPKTGEETKYVLLIMAGLIGVGFVSYIGYRKYKEI